MFVFNKLVLTLECILSIIELKFLIPMFYVYFNIIRAKCHVFKILHVT